MAAFTNKSKDRKAAGTSTKEEPPPRQPTSARDPALMAARTHHDVIVVSDDDQRVGAPAASGRSARRQGDPSRPRFERPPPRRPNSASPKGASSDKKSTPTSVRSPGSSRPQLAHGSAALEIDRTNPYASPLAHRSVVSVPHPVVAARKEQQSAMATRLYKEQLRREQDELAEAIERSLGDPMSDAFVIHDDEEIPSSEEDIIDLTRVLPVAPQARRERRKQEKRVTRIDERLRRLEEEEMAVVDEYDELQTALAMSLTQEERNREAAERKRLLDEQHAAYLESLAKDKAREAEERRIAEEQRMAAEAEQRRIAEEEAKRKAAQEALIRAAQADEEVGPEVSDAIELVLRLPDGRREALRFSRAATVGAVARAALRFGMQAGTFELMTDFPRKVFADYTRGLVDEGLTQRALLSVRPK